MATIKPIIRKSKSLKKGTHVIYIRLTNNGDTYFPIYKGDNRFHIVPEQWDKTNNRLVKNKIINPDHKNLNEAIEKRELRLRNIVEGFINSDEPWTVKMVKERFYNNYDKANVYDFIDSRIKKEYDLKKGSEAKNYEVVKKELENNSKGKLAFSDIDYDFVKGLINNMQQRGLNDTTIGIRLRYLRKTLNEAIGSQLGSKSTYPFSDKFGASKTIKISKFEKVERKIAIDLNAIDKIKETSFGDVQTERAKRLFLASYAGRGINFRDMSHLNKSNMYRFDGVTYLNYRRNKTGAQIGFPITPLLQEQLDWFKENTILKSDRLFPVDTKDLDKQLDSYNYYLKKIGKELEISDEDMKMSSYTARHSFVTNCVRNDVPMVSVQESMGHTSSKTTERYVKRFMHEKSDNLIMQITG